MKLARLLSLCFLALPGIGLAQTNLPLPKGALVEVTTPAGTVTGTVEEVASPGWICLRETQTGQRTFLKADSVIVREQPAAGGGVASLTVPAEALTAMALSSPSPAPSLAPDPSRAQTAREIAEEYGSKRFGLERLMTPRGARVASMSFEARRQSAGHLLYGAPEIEEADRFAFTPDGFDEPVEGMTVLVKEAFTLGHYDRLKLPAWVAMHWTLEDLVRSETVTFGRPSFRLDSDLPPYARDGTSLTFSLTKMERGHMARDADLEAWGYDAVTDGVTMSNIVPQRVSKNHVVWGRLENQHRFIVDEDDFDIDTVWVISGPIFDDVDAVTFSPGGVGIPDATYKVIGWLGSEEELHVRAYVIRQNDTDTGLTKYLRSVAEVEELTGLDFFPELDPAIANPLEAATFTTLWE